ncbi:hypothetical protein GCM10027579_25990 [Calidifontibacter terrae]
MVSAELAAAFPAVVFALVVVLGGATYGIAAGRAQDAARTAARSAARGDPPVDAAAVARRAAPGASIQISEGGGVVTARVTLRVAGPAAWLVPAHRVTATAVAPLEESDAVGP